MQAVPHCQHYVVRKKRFCRMTLKVGQEYCGEHLPKSEAAEAGEDGDKRITCPLDPKHTCFASKLAKHLKKCNAKQGASPIYISKGINSEIDDRKANRSTRLLSDVPIAMLSELIDKINKIHKDTIKCITEKHCKHAVLESELSKDEYGKETKKHLLQTSSIIGILESFGLLRSDSCYVEFGAGKGKLSYWISKALDSQNYSSSSVLLVERAAHRHKYDNKLDKSSGCVQRVRADIADLVLAKVEAVEKSKGVVGVTKHLCGEATDLALRCLMQAQAAQVKVIGVAMAFCCHHRCQWNNYTGREFFNRVGLTESDFDAMCGMVSWAVCGIGQSRAKLQKHEPVDIKNTRDIELKLTRDQKTQVGIKCKDLINWGRRLYLESHSFGCEFYYFVPSEVSLENVCMIGVIQK